MNGLGIRAVTRRVRGVRCPVCWQALNAAAIRSAVAATTLRGGIMGGHPSRLRRPGDAANQGWILWLMFPHRGRVY